MRILLGLAIFLASYSVEAQSFYDLKAKTIDGNYLKFENLRGKTVMIVNTASKCGYTHQYEDLQKLYEMYKGKDFVILGFPANDFLKQEPGSDDEINMFCSLNYGVSFPMMSKITVKGKNMHPIYMWLTKKELNKVSDSKIKWNFQKYIINKDGQLVASFSPSTEPFDEEIIKLIRKEAQERH